MGAGFSLRRGILKLLLIQSSGAGAQNWLLRVQQFPDSEAISLPCHPDGEPLNSIAEYAGWLHHYIHHTWKGIIDKDED
jgi:hypothetical protein